MRIHVLADPAQVRGLGTDHSAILIHGTARKDGARERNGRTRRQHGLANAQQSGAPRQ